MKVLVACEFSGVVREAFRKRWHDAWSCDLLEAEDLSFYHRQTDVLNILHEGWDMMIAHPPCTYLASSGARWWENRKKEQEKALEFVEVLMNAPIPRICIENPIGIISTKICKPAQIIQPWQFGHPEWKSTCLWLNNLPLLKPTNIVKPDMTVGGGKKPGRISSRLHRLGPSKDRQKIRSITFQGIADAMAEQWG